MAHKPMTPEFFESEMKRILETSAGDTEVIHARMDTLMEECLTELGYGAGTQIFKETDKWYA